MTTKYNNTKRMQRTSTNPFELTPSSDGVVYINIYSSGKTELGRALSPFSEFDIEHPEYGWFASVEAFYYWRKTGMKWDNLRPLYGVRAKQMGRRYETVHCDNFKEEIVYANQLKLDRHPYIRRLMKMNTLPFVHYYAYGSGEKATIVDKTSDYQHVIDYLNLVASELHA